MAVSSKPPPSSEIPGAPQGGGGPYLVGILVLAALAGALFVWKRSMREPTALPLLSTAVSAAITSRPEAPVFAPPPPPKLDDEPIAASDGDAGKVKSTGPSGPGPCGNSCAGQATGALQSALTSHARSAQGCYNRALRNSEVSGKLRVSVQVGQGGQVCSASIVEDTVHSTEVSSCVRVALSGRRFRRRPGAARR